MESCRRKSQQNRATAEHTKKSKDGSLKCTQKCFHGEEERKGVTEGVCLDGMKGIIINPRQNEI